ncbi:MAG: AI-2E family transporter [Candidatus Acidiferrales bacterium]
MDSRTTENSSSFPSLVTAVVCVAALYFGREVLIPIALAMLLTFLLGPIVTRLERYHMGKTAPALAVLFIAVMLIACLGWVVVRQGVRLATQLPTYSDTISRKIESLRGARNSKFARAASSIRDLGNQLSSALQVPASQTNQNTQTGGEKHIPATSNAKTAKPVPVEVVEPRNTLSFRSLRESLGPVLAPIAKIAIVFVVAAFMLLRRRDLQERLFTLAGLNRIHITKQVFTEATDRVVRYLWLLSCVNISYGLLFGTALYFLGLPNALLWGVLAGFLRFIPYIGSSIGAAMPILFSLAVFDGWEKPLIALGVFLVLEVVITYAVEPLLYGSRTGISSLAILVAAIFWAALWGPIGLILSTPLTLCIVVVGRYIPQLEFLSILLGDKSVGATDVQLYLALTSTDLEEAHRAIEEYIHEKSIRELYDSVFMPVLVLAERDQADEAYTGKRKRQLFHRLKGIIEELTIRYPRATAGHDDSSELSQDEQILPYRHPDAPAMTVSCFPARDQGDGVACIMLAHLLTRAGYDAHEIELGATREMLDEAAEHDGHIVCISALPPFAVSSIRRLYKRIQSRFPKCRVGIGLWTYTGDIDSMKSLLKLSDSDLLVTTLAEAALQIQQFIEPPESKASQQVAKK